MVALKTTTINDAWFQAVYACWNQGYDYHIDSGFYQGQERRQFDFFALEIAMPETRPLYIEMPEGCPVPSPNDEQAIENYALNYLLSGETTKNETYTYGSRMLNFPCLDGSVFNQVQWIIDHIKQSPGNNHCCINIPLGNDVTLKHAPCLRSVDFKIVNGKLDIHVYFRSWDLWAGFPTNLGGFQIFNEYVAQEIGIPTGKMFASSTGLHLYSQYFDVVKQRLGK